jgi:hypothetical protein
MSSEILKFASLEAGQPQSSSDQFDSALGSQNILGFNFNTKPTFRPDSPDGVAGEPDGVAGEKDLGIDPFQSYTPPPQNQRNGGLFGNISYSLEKAGNFLENTFTKNNKPLEKDPAGEKGRVSVLNRMGIGRAKEPSSFVQDVNQQAMFINNHYKTGVKVIDDDISAFIATFNAAKDLPVSELVQQKTFDKLKVIVKYLVSNGYILKAEADTVMSGLRVYSTPNERKAIKAAEIKVFRELKTVAQFELLLDSQKLTSKSEKQRIINDFDVFLTKATGSDKKEIVNDKELFNKHKSDRTELHDQSIDDLMKEKGFSRQKRVAVTNTIQKHPVLFAVGMALLIAGVTTLGVLLDRLADQADNEMVDKVPTQKMIDGFIKENDRLEAENQKIRDDAAKKVNDANSLKEKVDKLDSAPPATDAGETPVSSSGSDSTSDTSSDSSAKDSIWELAGDLSS